VLSSRNRRSIGGWIAGVAIVGGALLGQYVTQAAQAGQAALGTDPGAVQLNPASGPANSTPTWSTTVACPTGYQGSAVFSEVHANGTTFTTIAPVVTDTRIAFHGTLQGTIATIKSVGGIPNGGTQELFIQCASGLGGTGNITNYMDIYITYSIDGTSYTTSASAPSGTGGSASSTPSTGGTGTGSSSVPNGSVSPSRTPASSNPTPLTPPASPAPSPSAVPSNFAVTG
jgi:hypothetical protein